MLLTRKSGDCRVDEEQENEEEEHIRHVRVNFLGVVPHLVAHEAQHQGDQDVCQDPYPGDVLQRNCIFM